jgi:hypothetical protein
MPVLPTVALLLLLLHVPPLLPASVSAMVVFPQIVVLPPVTVPADK